MSLDLLGDVLWKNEVDLDVRRLEVRRKEALNAGVVDVQPDVGVAVSGNYNISAFCQKKMHC